MSQDPHVKNQGNQGPEAENPTRRVTEPAAREQSEVQRSKSRVSTVTNTGGLATPPEASAAPVVPQNQLAALPARVFGVMPTAVVLTLLVAIGYWGHHSGWMIPKFSELTGRAPQREEDWCEAHGVPESICIACNAKLMPKQELLGWCKKHGVAECVFDHPDRAQVAETPTVAPADFKRANRALALKERPKNNPACKLHLRRIQFASRNVADKVGIDIALVDRGRIIEAVPVTGEVIYDPTRVARLSSRAAGSAWRVECNVGDAVTQGDVLLLVDAAEVGRAKSELLQAAAELDLQVKNYQRLEGLDGVVSGRSILEAETARIQAEVAVRRTIQTLVNLGLPITYDRVRNTPLQELAVRIQFLGLPSHLTQRLDAERTTSNLIPIVVPLDGTVVRRDVATGEFVETAQPLVTVVDTTRMWLTMNVPLEQAKYVEPGQKVIFRPDGHDEHEGTVTWISTAVDLDTRTVQVRADLANNDGHLRDETFGVGQIVLREENEAIVVPNEAIHWEGCCHVVFVRDKDYMKADSYKVFHTRMVRPGITHGDYTEMLAGLLPGEVVVTRGSGVLRAELLKGNLGAG